MSDVDVEIKCLSCRKDEPDSGALTKHFFSSKQSKLKVNIMTQLQKVFLSPGTCFFLEGIFLILGKNFPNMEGKFS